MIIIWNTFLKKNHCIFYKNPKNKISIELCNQFEYLNSVLKFAPKQRKPSNLNLLVNFLWIY